MVPYTAGKIRSARLIFLFFWQCFEYIHCDKYQNFNKFQQQTQSYKFTSHIATFLSGFDHRDAWNLHTNIIWSKRSTDFKELSPCSVWYPLKSLCFIYYQRISWLSNLFTIAYLMKVIPQTHRSIKLDIFFFILRHYDIYTLYILYLFLIIIMYKILLLQRSFLFSHCELSIYMFLCSNIPAVHAYGVYLSELIRHSRACVSFWDFHGRELLLTRKLQSRGFAVVKLSHRHKKLQSLSWLGFPF